MIDERIFKINPIYNMWDNAMGNWIDLYVWFYLQNYYLPNYIIGKQDEWADWSKTSLNGVKSWSICRP